MNHLLQCIKGTLTEQLIQKEIIYGWSAHEDTKEHQHHASEGHRSYSSVATADSGITAADY